MQEHNLNPQQKGRSKGNTHLTQYQRFYEYLQEHVATASMVASATGLPQKNCTRFKRTLEKAGQLWELTKTTCKETGFKAWYITTDKAKAPKQSKQLTLF